jgi:SET domain-containing protein
MTREQAAASPTLARGCRVEETGHGRGVFATEAIAAGEWVLQLSPVFDDRPGRHTIQVGEHRHQAFTDEIDDYLNHSCVPNTWLDTDNLRVVALCPIAPGDEVTFDYDASEWDMAEPFDCRCGADPRVVRGFRHLTPAEQEARASRVPAWLWARRSVT